MLEVVGFLVQVGLREASVLGLLLFIMLVEALPKAIRLDKNVQKKCFMLMNWKGALKSKGLRVNVKKTRMMISGSRGKLKQDDMMYKSANRHGKGLSRGRIKWPVP